jgi:hypothetical protein
MGVFHGHCDEVSHLEHEQSETQGHHDDHQEEENGCSLCELASGGDDLSVVSAVLKFDLDSWVVRSVALADTHLKSVTNYSFQRAPPRLA